VGEAHGRSLKWLILNLKTVKALGIAVPIPTMAAPTRSSP